MAQHLHNDQYYAFLNKESGLYLAWPKQTSSHTHLVLKDPDFSGRKDEVFNLDNLKKHHSGNYEFDIKNAAKDRFIILSTSDERVESADLGVVMIWSSPLSWIMHQHSAESHDGFCRIEHKDSGKYLDIGSKEDHHGDLYARLSDKHDRRSQFWRCVHIDPSFDEVQTHTALLRGQNAKREYFKYPNASPARTASGHEKHSAAGVVGSGPYTGPNLCGDPTCGLDHICNADYDRRRPAVLAGYDPEDPAN